VVYLYISGKLKASDKVLVDIGTGYVLEKTAPQANEYFDRQIAMLKENIDRLSQMISTKRKTLDSIVMVMQHKIASISQQQQVQQAPVTAK
jgi:prefoldin alpha subunit